MTKYNLQEMLAQVQEAARELNYSLNNTIDIQEFSDDSNQLSSWLSDCNNKYTIKISKKFIELLNHLPQEMFEGILFFNICHEFGHIIIKQGITPKFVNNNDDFNKKKEYEADNLAIEIMFKGMKLPINYRPHIDFYFLFFHYKNDVEKVPDGLKYHPKNLDRKTNLNQIINQL